MLVWIFQTGEPLHIDGEFARPMRAMNLANALISNGDEVVIWSSNFFHQKMKHRFKKKKSIAFSKNLNIKLINSIGYKSHIGIGRILDHAQLAINLYLALKKYKGKLPDKVFIGYPPIEFAFIAACWCRKYKIPFILDIKDLWPDIFLENIPKSLKKYVKFILYPFFIMGIWTCKKASSISSITKEYLDWIYNFAKIKPKETDFIFPLTTINNFKKNKNKEKITWIENVISNSNKDTRIILFAGSFIEGLNIEPLIYAAQRALKEKKYWIFILCGDGPKWEKINEKIGNFENTYMPGWVNPETINNLSQIPTIGVVLFKDIPNFSLSISNKTYQYLSLGIPIFSSLSGALKNLINKYNIGVNFKSKNNKSLYICIDKYFSDKSIFQKQSKNARDLFRKMFDGNIVYKNAINKIKQIE